MDEVNHQVTLGIFFQFCGLESLVKFGKISKFCSAFFLDFFYTKNWKKKNLIVTMCQKFVKKTKPTFLGYLY